MLLDEAVDTWKSPPTPYPWFLIMRIWVIDAEILVSNVLRYHKTKRGANTGYANGEQAARFCKGDAPGHRIQQSDCFFKQQKAVEETIAAKSGR
jgi:hypothetical protein